MNSLNNKSALITGGTKGIGLGIAKALLKEGVQVTITGRNQNEIDLLVAKLEQQYPKQVLGIEADVRNYEQQQKAIRMAVDQFGKIDILIANAGLGFFAPVEDMPIEKWQQIIDTNLTGPFYTLKAGVEQLKKQKGYFITLSSLAGTNFFKGGSAYNASKFGLTGFTQAVMLDLRQYGIKTTTIMPGSVATHFNKNEPNETDAWKIQKEDLGQMVVDLLKMPARTLPSKIEVRPSMPPIK